MSDTFPKPLDVEIQEPHEFETEVVDFDPKTQMLSKKRVTKRVYIATKYTKASVSKISCKKGEHSYTMIDRHKYIAACGKCTKRRFMNGAYETIKDGHIISRDTKQIID